jgi:Fuc2NAc and GlcNAc transferase
LIVYFINIYNFIDGIDGYAGAQAIFLGLAGYMIWGDLHFLILVASVSGFLILNWHKAKIFMGDVGSTLLGYNVAIFVIYYQNSSIQSITDMTPDNGTSVLVWGVLFGMFWVDATLTILRRYFNAEELSKPHKKHFYQRLVQSGYSHSKVVTLAMMVNVVLFSLVYFIDDILVVFLISTIIFYAIIKFVDNKKKFDRK